MSGKPIVLRLNDEFFDWDKVIVEEPTSYKRRGASTQNITSKVYFDVEGEKRPIFIELAPQDFWVSEIHTFGLPMDQWTEETLEGYQIPYPMTSLNTIENPTNDELAIKQAFDSMYEVACDAMENFCSVHRSECKVPAPTYSAFGVVKMDGDWSYAVKPMYDFQLTKDEKTGKKVADKSKPLKSYIKLKTWGKGKKLYNDADLYGPGNELVHPRDLKRIRVNGHPVIKWEGIFWGSHGKKSYGASLTLRVTEMNFTPAPAGGDFHPKYRILKPNNAPKEMDITEDDDDDDYLSSDDDDVELPDFFK